MCFHFFLCVCVCVLQCVFTLKQFITWQLIMMLCIVYWSFRLIRFCLLLTLSWKGTSWDGSTIKLLPKIPTQVITCQLKLWNHFFHVISLPQTLFVYISNSWIFVAVGFISWCFFAVFGSWEIPHYFSSWGSMKMSFFFVFIL